MLALDGFSRSLRAHEAAKKGRRWRCRHSMRFFSFFFLVLSSFDRQQRQKNSFQNQDGAHVQFKTKRSTQLKKLMKAYCERMNRE